VDTERWRRLETLFDEAVKQPLQNRVAFVERVTGGDAEMRVELLSLLTASDAASGFLEKPGEQRIEEGSAVATLSAGARVGAWRIVRLIGRGGMGEVYEAERADGQFEQRAAIKLAQPGSAALLERFNAERQILARLDHPGIARLLDGGLASDGRPYAVLEYVDGLTLTEYCRSRQSDLAERLSLFQQVCSIVAYAHRNLVVHRDLKPQNILVDSDGRVRLLDFGIAKLLGQVPAAELTRAPMTPDYAAPEQLTGETVTTATDVFALGVLLFELLTGDRPWHNEGLPVASAVKRLLNEPAPLPSRAADKLADAPNPARRLRGDLDAIVSKCLRKEPEHRYSSVESLRSDIERHLRHEPVLAREHARRYVLGRFLRRYRWPVVATAAIVASLAAGLMGVLWQAKQVALERDIAQRAASREEAVRYQLVGLFRSAVSEPGTEPVTAKTMLDRSAQRVIEQYRDDPQLASKVVETLADLYGALGDTEAQAPLLEGFLEVASGPDAARLDPASVAVARHKLAGIEVWRGNLERAEPLLGQAEMFWAAAGERYREQRLEAALIRGQLQRAQGRIPQSIDTYRAALRERIALSGTDHRETATLYNSLAIALTAANRFDEALVAYRESLAIHQRLGRSEEIDALVMLGNTGALALQTGRLAEAERILASAVQKQEANAGESAALAAAMGRLGVALSARAEFAEALPVLRRAVAMAEQHAGPASPLSVQSRLFLADALASAGQRQPAELLLDQNLAVARERFGDEHLLTLRIQLSQSRLAFAAGKADESREQVRQLIGGLRKLGAPAEATLAQALLHEADALMALARARDAIEPLEEAVRLRERLMWSESWELAQARARLGEARLSTGDTSGAALLRMAATTLQAQLGAGHPQAQRASRALGTLAATD
jgi:eukaryotic-like serine/threonine-protein kinase